MQRIVIHRPGGYEQLVLEEHADPQPRSDEVLVAVRAIGVNYADVLVRMGLYSSARRYVGWPITPGFEFAGEVLACGSTCSRFAPGDEVLGVTRFGAYATHVVVPATQLFPKPQALDWTQAAAFPTAALTAHYALFRLAEPAAGELVLVHSAAGGVGSALVQLAKAAGCKVVAVVGAPHKVAVARALGADHVIDKSRQLLWESARALGPDGYQAIFDANGPTTLRQSYRHLCPSGRLVIYGFHSLLPRQGGRPSWLRLLVGYLFTPRFNPLSMTQHNHSVMAFNLSCLFHRTDLLQASMTDLLARLARGQLRAPEVTSYPLAQAAEAHRALESGQTIGKLALVV